MVYQGDALKYIYETPDILRSILQGEQGILRESVSFLENRKISEIYLAGSGSSYNSAQAVSAFAKKLLGIRFFPVYPTAILEESFLISRDAVVIGISQQGTSAAVIQALDEMHRRGIATLSVTGEYDTEITRHGDANLYIECGYEDAGATTKGYTATVVTLLLLICAVAQSHGKISQEEAAGYKSRIEAVVNNMSVVLDDSQLWCERTAEKLKECRDLMILSGGSLDSMLREGVLKFSETCRFPVRGYEAEEFMHGMYNAVTEQVEFLYLFPAEGYEVQRMKRLYGYYSSQKNRQYAINMPRYEMPCTGENILSCRFRGDADFSILEYMLPQQLLFVLTSRARGIDLNRPKDPDFHKYMGSKLENIKNLQQSLEIGGY